MKKIKLFSCFLLAVCIFGACGSNSNTMNKGKSDNVKIEATSTPEPTPKPTPIPEKELPAIFRNKKISLKKTYKVAKRFLKAKKYKDIFIQKDKYNDSIMIYKDDFFATFNGHSNYVGFKYKIHFLNDNDTGVAKNLFGVFFDYTSGEFLDYMYSGKLIALSKAGRTSVTYYNSEQNSDDNVYTSKMLFYFDSVIDDPPDEGQNSIESMMKFKKVINGKNATMRVTDNYKSHEYKITKKMIKNFNEMYNLYMDLLQELNKIE